MSKNLLLVIDMLRDFIDEDGVLNCGPAGRKIVPFVVEKINEFKKAGEPVIYINDEHEPDDLEFNRFPPHCVKNTDGARLVEDIESLLDNDSIVVPKNRYSGFYNTELEEILARIKPAEVHVVGVCTNICVLYTVEELCNRDISCTVYKNGVASFDDEAHLWALNQMESVLGAKIK